MYVCNFDLAHRTYYRTDRAKPSVAIDDYRGTNQNVCTFAYTNACYVVGADVVLCLCSSRIDTRIRGHKRDTKRMSWKFRFADSCSPVRVSSTHNKVLMRTR